jgi:hypothetical protein
LYATGGVQIYGILNSNSTEYLINQEYCPLVLGGVGGCTAALLSEPFYFTPPQSRKINNPRFYKILHIIVKRIISRFNLAIVIIMLALSFWSIG